MEKAEVRRDVGGDKLRVGGVPFVGWEADEGLSTFRIAPFLALTTLLPFA